MITFRSFRSVFGDLVTEGLLTTDVVEGLESRSSEVLAADAPPWYVRLVVGAAAWLSSVLVLAFIWLLGGIGTEDFLILGILAAISAIVLTRVLHGATVSPGVRTDFAAQLALVGSFLARLLIAVGAYHLTDNTESAVMALLVLELAYLALYPDRLQRFIATIGAASWLMWLVLDSGLLATGHVFVVAVAALTGAVWLEQPKILKGRFSAWQAPVGFGLATFLCGSLGFMAWAMSGESSSDLALWIEPVGITLLVIVLVDIILRVKGVPRGSPVVMGLLAGVVAVAALTWREPGVVAAIGLIVLGHHSRSRPLIVLAGLSLIAFGVRFYYNLDIDLLHKSGVLAGSGLVMLAARAIALRAFSEWEESPS